MPGGNIGIYHIIFKNKAYGGTGERDTVRLNKRWIRFQTGSTRPGGNLVHLLFYVPVNIKVNFRLHLSSL